MELRKHTTLGYKTFTGKKFTRQYQVDRYNAIQDRINSFLKAGRIVPETLLDESFQAFISVCY